MTFKTLFATTVATCAFAVNALAADITVSDAWARASAGMMGAGGAFMTIKNAGAEDTLVDAKAGVSKTVELHTHIMDGNVMKMRKVEGGIPVPAHGEQKLEPGSYHVMFMGLNAPLEEGQIFPLTLTFKSGQEVTVDVTVKAAGSMGMGNAPDAMAGHGHGPMNQGNMPQGNMPQGNMPQGNMPMKPGN